METRKAKELAHTFAVRNHLTNPMLVRNLERFIEKIINQDEFDRGKLSGENMRLKDRVASLEARLKRKAKWANAWKQLAKVWKR